MKTRLYFAIVLLSLFTSVVNAQEPEWEWAKALSGPSGTIVFSVTVDPSGSGDVYSTGQFGGTTDFDPGAGVFNLTSAGVSDIFVCKLDPSGNFIWAKAMGGTEYDYGRSIVVDPANGEVYITGEFSGTVDFDPGSGTFNLSTINTLSSNAFVVKLDSAGNFEWAKGVEGTSIYGQSIAIDAASGDIYTTGRFAQTADFDPGDGVFNLTSEFAHDVFILKLDSSGNFVWVKAIFMLGYGYDFDLSITVDPANGDVYTAGAFEGTVDFDPNEEVVSLATSGGFVNSDIFISKLDSAGNFVWAKAMGGASQDSANSIAIDPASGHVYTTGTFKTTADFDPSADAFMLTGEGGNNHIFISKLDNSGDFVWAKALSGANLGVNVGFGASVAVDPTGSGDVYTAGNFTGTIDFDPDINVTFNLTSAGDNDIFISKFDAGGNFVWAKAAGAEYDDSGWSIALDPTVSEVIYVAGNFGSLSITFSSTILTNADNTGNSSDAFIARLDATTGLESIGPNYNISLYPNPTTSQFQIESPSQNISSIIIHDVLGKEIFKTNCSSNKCIVNTTRWNRGVYFVKIILDESEVMRKVVLE